MHHKACQRCRKCFNFNFAFLPLQMFAGSYFVVLFHFFNWPLEWVSPDRTAAQRRPTSRCAATCPLPQISQDGPDSRLSGCDLKPTSLMLFPRTKNISLSLDKPLSLTRENSRACVNRFPVCWNWAVPGRCAPSVEDFNNSLAREWPADRPAISSSLSHTQTQINYPLLPKMPCHIRSVKCYGN